MCTVTWLPISESHAILTSNRDEVIFRQAESPDNRLVGSDTLLFPKDPKAGGTWIAANDTRIVCLLNGAFLKHPHTPPYRRSRGLVVIDTFEYVSIQAFTEVYNFENIEPFTMIISEETSLFEMRWDGTEIFLKQLNPREPYLWASATLYSEEIIQKRKAMYQYWFENTADKNCRTIMDFHQGVPIANDENSFLIDRGNGLKTISITSVERTTAGVEMVYKDIEQDICICTKHARISCEEC